MARRMKTNKPTNPWAAIDAMVKQDPEPMGPEWFTKEDFAARYGYTLQTANNMCRRMFCDGKLKRWIGTASYNRRKTAKYAAA